MVGRSGKEEVLIVKIQVALFSSQKNPPALICSQDRTIEEFCDASLVADIMLERPKAYFKAHIDKNKKLVIGEEVEEQKW